MSALVIRNWKANESAINDRGHRILIEGREGGLLTWLLQLVRIEPVTRLHVSAERLELEKSSLSGKEHVFVPLEHVCHCYYGYHKPWKNALLIWFLNWYLLSMVLPILAALITSDRHEMGGSSMLFSRTLAFLFATGLAFLYYILSKSFLIGIETESGKKYELCFRRSLIENQQIDADEAAYVAELLDFLCDARRSACKGIVGK